MPGAPLNVALTDWVALRARTHPAHVALECSGEVWDYATLEARVASSAGALRAEGIEAGEPVAVLANNGLPIARFAHAIPRAGALFMPLNARLSAGEIAWQLRDSGARFLLHDASLAPLAIEAATETGVRLLAVEDARWDAGMPVTPLATIEADRAHSVIYTSGTTGRPKGAVLTHGNFHWSAVASGANLGVEADDRWLACMPLFHVGGLSILLRSATYGITAVIHERFDEARVDHALREERITLLSVVATMLQRVFAVAPGAFPPTLRGVLLGGGPAPRPLLEEAARRGMPVLQTYGLTETCSQVATLGHVDALRKLGSAGLPLSTSTVRVEVDGREAEPGEVGEILVAGPTVCAGYLHRPDATATAIRDGWLHTGDLGWRDSEGYLYVADRRDDLIVSGGENVYPAEVESALLEHPAVEECAVVGLPDDRWGARVVAVLVLHASVESPSAAALETHLRARLAGYKLPREIIVEAVPLPRTASGKLQRHLVRDRLRAGR